MAIPSQAIFSFLNQSIDAIQDNNNNRKIIPQFPQAQPEIALTESCRQHILQVQINVLHQVVGSYDVSVGTMQAILLKLGTTKDCYYGIKFTSENEEEEEKIMMRTKVTELNDKSRLCLCRLLLQHSVDLCQDHKTITINNPQPHKSRKMESNHLLEFLSLFHTMVHLPDVLEYIQYGTMIPSHHNGMSSNDQSHVQRMHYIQNILILSLGYKKPEDVALEKQVHQLLSQPNNQTNLDSHQEFLINHYLSAIQYVTQSESQIPLPSLDDRPEGGVTHVISVSLTNPSSTSTTTSPPSSLVMPEQKEHSQKSQLQAAQQTSALEHRIRQKLSLMSDDERVEQMVHAKELQETFVKRALELPSGLERVRFMQSWKEEDQELLIMYKIYCQECI